MRSFDKATGCFLLLCCAFVLSCSKNQGATTIIDTAQHSSNPQLPIKALNRVAGPVALYYLAGPDGPTPSRVRISGVSYLLSHFPEQVITLPVLSTDNLTIQLFSATGDSILPNIPTAVIPGHAPDFKTAADNGGNSYGIGFNGSQSVVVIMDQNLSPAPIIIADKQKK